MQRKGINKKEWAYKNAWEIIKETEGIVTAEVTNS